LLAIVSAPPEWPMHVFHGARPCPVTFRQQTHSLRQRKKKLKIMAACRRISIQRRETIRRDHMPSRKSTRCRSRRLLKQNTPQQHTVVTHGPMLAKSAGQITVPESSAQAECSITITMTIQGKFGDLKFMWRFFLYGINVADLNNAPKE